MKTKVESGILEDEYAIPEENSGRFPSLFIAMVGFLIGWALTYCYYNLGDFASLKDNTLLIEICEKGSQS
ncbi:MAG: hypothetical protein HRU19_26695 [Pseudobacteriovorax sp.]|nr:hypothetical protein [Pseudobacteriovorax sp.]